MSPSAAELLRELFELFHRGGGVEAALPLLADDVVAVVPPALSAALAVMAVSGVGAVTRIPIEIDAVIVCTARRGRIVRMAAHPDLETARNDRDRGPPQLS